MDEDALPVIREGHEMFVEEDVDVRSKEQAVVQGVVAGLGVRNNMAGFEHGFFVSSRESTT